MHLISFYGKAIYKYQTLPLALFNIEFINQKRVKREVRDASQTNCLTDVIIEVRYINDDLLFSHKFQIQQTLCIFLSIFCKETIQKLKGKLYENRYFWGIFEKKQSFFFLWAKWLFKINNKEDLISMTFTQNQIKQYFRK